MRITIDECKERTARMHAKKDAFIRSCFSSSQENKDEDLKVIDVSPIKSLFCNMNLDNEHVAQAWERMKLMIRNCPTHGLNLWMIIQIFMPD